MRFVWLTDTHLNFLSSKEREGFYQTVEDQAADGVLISGDIAEAPCVADILIEMAAYVGCPIYFVLGNHDYYLGRVANVREDIQNLCAQHALLHWLPQSRVIQLTEQVVLVGDDCWADGRFGHYAESHKRLNDSRLIQDLAEANILGKFQLLDAMQKLADADADRLKRHMLLALDEHPQKILIMVHVPPFIENSWHEGKLSDDHSLPFFASKITGDVLLEVAAQHQDTEFVTLCGHTHSDSLFQPLPNLIVKTGAAIYKQPSICDVIEL